MLIKYLITSSLNFFHNKEMNIDITITITDFNLLISNIRNLKL